MYTHTRELDSLTVRPMRSLELGDLDGYAVFMTPSETIGRYNSGTKEAGFFTDMTREQAEEARDKLEQELGTDKGDFEVRPDENCPNHFKIALSPKG